MLDNNLNESLNIEINKTTYSLNPNSFEEIELKTGNYNFLSYTNNNDTIQNTSININDIGIINASNTRYILWTDIFCEEEDYGKYKSKLNLQDTVLVDGLEFINIDFKFLNNPFIKKNWDIGLNEKMPDSTTLGKEDNFKIISKIYRPKDIKKEFNYLGDIDFTDLTEEEIINVLENR